MKIKFVSGNFLLSDTVTLEIDNVKVTRKVRFRKDCGLYIVYQNKMYFEYEVDYDN